MKSGAGAASADGVSNAHDESGVAPKIGGVGADSTAANTGLRRGAIPELQRCLGNPLHWFILQSTLARAPAKTSMQEAF